MLQLKHRRVGRMRLIAYSITAFMAVSLTACSDSGDGAGNISPPVASDPNDVVPPRSDALIPEWLSQTDYSIFLELIEEADLAMALFGDNNGQEWTVFALPDSAFANVDLDLLDDTQRLALPKLHVYSGLLETSDFVAGDLSMLEGNVEIVIGTDGKFTVGGSTIVARDRRLANGVIHVINAVMTQSPNP